MRVHINGVPRQIDGEDVSSLYDLIVKIQLELGHDVMMTDVEMKGEKLDLQQTKLEALKDVALQDVSDVHINTMSLMAVIQSDLKSSERIMVELVEKVEAMNAAIAQGNRQHGGQPDEGEGINDLFLGAMDHIEWLDLFIEVLERGQVLKRVLTDDQLIDFVTLSREYRELLGQFVQSKESGQEGEFQNILQASLLPCLKRWQSFLATIRDTEPFR